MFKSVSIIYPLYNEEMRLQKTFLDIEKFDKSNKFIKKEYIFVNDGSSDQTLSLLKKKFKKKNKFKILSYTKNKGKGYALKKGVQIAKNDWILTTDADCSVSNFQLNNWLNKKYFKENILIYFGSRNLKSSIVKKKIQRKFLGLIFIYFIRFLFDIKISDTQCGFKFYRSTIAKKIFRKIITNEYMHDIEICLIAKKFNLNIQDLPVKWTHVDYGKINFIKDFFKVFFHLVKISRHIY